ncbi:hypothetical protein CFP56_024367 [Quercus suber]|uniref:Uncharacterized protein n=1 Tax=Quercus suber TaxID=58331 RepID=A0AAW0MAW0_QUESU
MILKVVSQKKVPSFQLATLQGELQSYKRRFFQSIGLNEKWRRSSPQGVVLLDCVSLLGSEDRFVQVDHGTFYRPRLISKKNESSIKLQVGQSSKNIKCIKDLLKGLIVVVGGETGYDDAGAGLFSVNLEQENGPEGLMAWVFHEEVQPPEFYSSSNQCLREE